MPNGLANEISPYLLQHANNPVHWLPWSEMAFARARDEAKPIFLSIGYAACHWCHVMERESFENEQIASRLNAHFISVKVDREERPDIDQIYMSAVQLMTGQGGWPMSMFLTPDRRPFFGGTYWPPEARHGLAGFDQVLEAVVDAWNSRRARVIDQSQQIADRVTQMAAPSFRTTDSENTGLNEPLLRAAIGGLERQFDHRLGGFGDAPKFPQPMALDFLLGAAQHDGRGDPMVMVTRTLDAMATGGIYDHLGGGFARYSVDAGWLVPHFEKMLYDNALLASTYLDGFRATGVGAYRQVAKETLEYVLQQMTDANGGFYSSEDADSEGVEGKFYVWSLNELQELLGEKADRFATVYGVTANGNFEGKNILHLPVPVDELMQEHGWPAEEVQSELAESRSTLLEHRHQRERPARDDKVLADWNGMMVRAMARAAIVLDDPRYAAAAERAAQFVLTQMQDASGRLFHCWRHGTPKVAGFLDDYACMAWGLVELYEATWNERWIDEAFRMIEVCDSQFRDPDSPGYFFTANDQPRLVARTKPFQDNATPCGNSVLATTLVRLARLTGCQDKRDVAEQMIRAAVPWMRQSGLATSQWLVALQQWLEPYTQVVLIGPAPRDGALLRDLRNDSHTGRVILFREETADPCSPHLDAIFEGRTAIHGQLTAYLCRGQTCEPPRCGEDAIRQRLRGCAE